MRAPVNELILARLAAADKVRLEQHADSVRDFEVMTAAMEDAAGNSTLDAFSLDVARLHCDLIALVLRS